MALIFVVDMATLRSTNSDSKLPYILIKAKVRGCKYISVKHTNSCGTTETNSTQPHLNYISNIYDKAILLRIVFEFVKAISVYLYSRINYYECKMYYVYTCICVFQDYYIIMWLQLKKTFLWTYCIKYLDKLHTSLQWTHPIKHNIIKQLIPHFAVNNHPHTCHLTSSST